jgi:hypothetical protein
VVLPPQVVSARADTEPLAAETAVFRTLAYADVFDFPLSAGEIHRFLEELPATTSEVQTMLERSDWLAGQVARVGGWYLLRGREDLAPRREVQMRQARRLWPAARFFGRILAHLPFVRMVAVTGALAVDNIKPDGDIDYLILTAPGRVWLARAAAIVVVRLSRLAGYQLCPNYFLAVTALDQDRRNLFVAHELAQMVPLSGLAWYWRMRSANHWADEFLPNAGSLPGSTSVDLGPSGWGLRLQQGLEWLFSGSLVDRLESWERTRKTRRFQSRLHQPGSAARLDAERVQGHFNDYGTQALDAYERRCRAAPGPVRPVVEVSH